MKVQNFSLSTVYVIFHQICTLIDSFRWKYIKFQLKKLCLVTLNSDAKFEGKPICCFKNDKNLVKFDLSTQNSQYFFFDWLVLCKVYNVWPKKIQRSYLPWHWEVMKNLKKNWLVVWKIAWRIWQIFTRALKSPKIRTMRGSFYPK